MAVSADQRQALKLLASSPDGCTRAVFKTVMLNGLVRDRLATTTPRNVRAGTRSIDVRMMITDGGGWRWAEPQGGERWKTRLQLTPSSKNKVSAIGV
jgi:hypothetical protein